MSMRGQNLADVISETLNNCEIDIHFYVNKVTMANSKVYRLLLQRISNHYNICT